MSSTCVLSSQETIHSLRLGRRQWQRPSESLLCEIPLLSPWLAACQNTQGMKSFPRYFCEATEPLLAALVGHLGSTFYLSPCPCQLRQWHNGAQEIEGKGQCEQFEPFPLAFISKNGIFRRAKSQHKNQVSLEGLEDMGGVF